MKKPVIFPWRGDARPWAAAASFLAAAALITAGIRTAQYEDRQNTLKGIYQKAFYETCELTESMAVNLSKLSVAGKGAREVLLGDIISQSQGAQANLALLPLGTPATAATMKFINQVGDFSDGLLARLASGQDITESEHATISTLSENAARLTLDFGRLLERYDSGEITLDGVNAGVTDLSPITDPASSYPTLLYDGPFSDGASGTRFIYLEGLRDVTQEEAGRMLTDFVGKDAVTDIRFEGENPMPTPIYEFTVSAGGRELSAGVTKTGGQILYLLCADAGSDVRLTPGECIRRADEFLLSQGYAGMVMNYHSRYGGIMTINYAASQTGITLYPDLIKIQISMDDGSVVGMEAGNYLRNHHKRQLEIPALSQEDALSQISPHLSAESVRLCVIPAGTGEKMCYEIRAKADGSEYLIYIDAMTGAEAEIMQVVVDGSGTLVM